MYTLEIESEYSQETGEEINNPTFWIKENEKIIEEAFWLTDEDSDESMRELGFVPVEEKYQSVTGYREYGETLYVKQ